MEGIRNSAGLNKDITQVSVEIYHLEQKEDWDDSDADKYEDLLEKRDNLIKQLIA